MYNIKEKMEYLRIKKDKAYPKLVLEVSDIISDEINEEIIEFFAKEKDSIRIDGIHAKDKKDAISLLRQDLLNIQEMVVEYLSFSGIDSISPNHILMNAVRNKQITSYIPKHTAGSSRYPEKIKDKTLDSVNFFGENAVDKITEEISKIKTIPIYKFINWFKKEFNDERTSSELLIILLKENMNGMLRDNKQFKARNEEGNWNVFDLIEEYKQYVISIAGGQGEAPAGSTASNIQK